MKRQRKQRISTVLTVMLTVLLLVGMMVACGKSEKTTTHELSSEPETTEQHETAPPETEPSTEPTEAETTEETTTEATTEAATEPATEPSTEPEAETETESETEAETEPTDAEAAGATVTYVANKNTMKFHRPDCASVKDIKDENRWDFTGTREELIKRGYVPCKRCNP